MQMSEFAPTPSQREAIETTGCSLLISAGAGSGKTKVLTERVMNYVLCGGCNIDDFVIITFTKAAAGELKDRLTNILSTADALAAAEGASSEYRRHIRRQRALIGKAQIGTIHHFCMSVLKENAHEAGLPPDFKIISDERAAAMREEVLSDVLNEHYSHMDRYPGFETLVNTVGSGRDDSKLEELVLSLYEKMQSHAFPQKWANDCVEKLSAEPDDVSDTVWGKEILSGVLSSAEYWSAQMDRLVLKAGSDSQMKIKYMPSLQTTAESIREFLRCAQTGWDRAMNAPEITFPRFLSLANPDNPDQVASVKAMRDLCKKEMAKTRNRLSTDTAALMTELRLTAPPMRALLELTCCFMDAFDVEKVKKGYADYSDLEHKTVRLLTDDNGNPTELAAKIASGYREILVDEYQDVSRVQDAIFSAVSQNNNNLFLVGDVKQAIYRFRLADPEIFNEKYRTFRRSSEAEGNEPRKIFLKENFRSRREILDCANTVFSHCMSGKLGDVDYNEDASLVFGSSEYPDGTDKKYIPQIYLVPSGTKGKTETEAAFVADKILSLAKDDVQYGDIAILLRSANATGGVFRRELVRRGIPVMTGQGGGFFETREISLITSVLRIIDNPNRDPDLIAVLSSPVSGFSADDLAAVRQCDMDSSFFAALKLYAAENEKAAIFLSLLSSLRTAAPDLTADRLIREILSRTDLPAVFSAMPDGAQRIANIERLISLAVGFEADGRHGLHRFVKYLEKLEESDSEIPSCGNDESSVRIMSIHKSKGLEFPIVFLCGTGKKFNTTDTSDTVLVHSSLGLGPKIVDTERMIAYPTLARAAIDQRMKKEMLSEEMRLLYVAMTRPKERLFITACLNNPEKEKEKWSGTVRAGAETIDAEILSGSQNYLGWLLAAEIADRSKNIKTVIVEAADSDSINDAAKDGSTADSAAASMTSASAAAESDASNDEDLADIERKLSYVYPYEEASMLPSKVTATELKKYSVPDDDESYSLVKQKTYFSRPSFSEKALSPTERGIATHLALQYMDFSAGSDEQTVKAEILRLRDKGFLSERQADAVNASAISGLFTSPIGKRIKSAGTVHRELRFSLLCDAEELFGRCRGEEILLQGVVDCCIEEDGELVIIDYKTDSIHTEEQFRERCALYSGQLRAYSLALERMFGKKVKETVLFFLMSGMQYSSVLQRQTDKKRDTV